ncbi:11561_t:CDS:1 [Cetraspora pellucida]|uniref:11561_t:CDS:1 n=1 Tax=Cetraspora pellucida TaxID=1433469 RepID=A0ACA9PNF7_9GLOM|nr:11561_t:CDS:1 [Cetraspora pellucida]
MVPYTPFNPQKSIMFQENNMMNQWSVPWPRYIVIRKRPALGKTCSRCGTMGHTVRSCPIVLNTVRNLKNIKYILKNYFENPTPKIKLYKCCGEIGHSQKRCPVYNAAGSRGYCITDAHKNELVKGIDKFKKEYGLNNKIIPQFLVPQGYGINNRIYSQSIPSRNLLTY